MLTLYRFPLSGHSHRAELFLSLLGIEARKIDVDLGNRQHKTPEYLKMHPLGLVPVLMDGETAVPDSNAILVYLAETPGAESWYPANSAKRARIQFWLSFAANNLANGPAAARLVTVFGAKLDHEAAKTKAHAALEAVETALTGADWLAGNGPTIADIACYSYIAHAPEGGVSLEPYPSTRKWLARIEALPGFIPMPATRTPEHA